MTRLARGKNAARPRSAAAAGRQRVARDRALTEERLRFALDLNERAASLSEAQVLRLYLDEAVRLTGSTIGYLHEVQPDQQSIRLTAWNEAALRTCKATAAEHYPLHNAGVWADCVRNRRAVVHNDYPRLASRRGLPPGHQPLARHLSVPVFDGAEIRLVLGVGNKPTDYDELDVMQVELVAADAQRLVLRLRAERAQRESEAQLAAVVDAALDAIVSVDDRGRIVVFNAAAEEAFGVPAAAALGGPVERFIPAADGGATAALTGPSGPAARCSTILCRRADGTTFPAEPSRSSTVVAGRTLSTLILRDVSERGRAELEQQRLQAALASAATEWTRTFDALDSGIVIADSEGRVLRLNRAAAAFAERDLAGCLGVRLGELGRGEPWRSASALLGQLGNRGLASSFAPVADPVRCRWWDLTATGFTTDAGPRAILLIRDVTAFVRLQESARRDEQMAAMGRVTSGVAHEVRNPLFAISANVDALGVVIGANPAVEEIVDAVRLEVKRLNALMVDLLQFGRSPAPVLMATPLAGVVELAVQFARARSIERGVALRVETGPRDLAVRADRERLAEALENVLENAIQHSPPGAEVCVDLTGFEQDGRPWVRCQIGDRGPGFGAEDLARLFEPFFSRRAGGTGLGLAIARQTVGQHGGRIEARNREGGGALVSVELPCAETGPAGAGGAGQEGVS